MKATDSSQRERAKETALPEGASEFPNNKWQARRASRLTDKVLIKLKVPGSAQSSGPFRICSTLSPPRSGRVASWHIDVRKKDGRGSAGGGGGTAGEGNDACLPFPRVGMPRHASPGRRTPEPAQRRDVLRGGEPVPTVSRYIRFYWRLQAPHKFVNQ